MTCSDCVYAEFRDNKTGNPSVKGTCTYPMPKVPDAVQTQTYHITYTSGKYCCCFMSKHED